MHISRKWLLFPILSFIIFICLPLGTNAELIEPTRSLKGEKELPGKLSVFSEPPQQDVILDGVKIGKTPVVAVDIEPGTHVLRVRDSEKKIIVQSGEPLHLSWHRGSFIVVPVKSSEGPKPQEKQEATPPRPVSQSESPSKKNENDRPLYWPFNPSGPIY
jgi:hypothetical protein